MTGHLADHLFLYVLLTAAVVMAAVGYFIIAPLERKNHERKLALLQEKLKQHEAQLKNGTNIADETDTESA
jgi:hypothetical protein